MRIARSCATLKSSEKASQQCLLQREIRFSAKCEHPRAYRVAQADGRTEVICDVNGFATSTWSRDNVIVYAVEGKLYRVSGNGGEPQPLPAVEGAGLPQFLSDGDHLLFGIRARQSDLAGFWLMSLKSDERKRILPFATFVTYSPTGRLLYLRDGKLFAQAFDSSKLELTGEPALLTKEAGATDFVDYCREELPLPNPPDLHRQRPILRTGLD